MDGNVVIPPESYLTEQDVQSRWTVLKPGEIRRARKAGTIDYFAFPVGPRFTEEAVQRYIDHHYSRAASWRKNPSPLPPEMNQATALPPAGNTAGSTSKFPTPTGEASIMPAGMTPELALSAAEACTQRMVSKRAKPLSPSLQPRRRVPQKSAQTREMS